MGLFDRAVEDEICGIEYEVVLVVVDSICDREANNVVSLSDVGELDREAI